MVEIKSIWHRQYLFFSPSASANARRAYGKSSPRRMVSTTLQQLTQAVDRIASVHTFVNFDKELLSSSPCRVLKPGMFTLREHYGTGKRLAYLVIRPSEIPIFYHCGSGNLLQQMLAGGIPYDRIYLQKASPYDPEKEKLFIRICRYLPNSNALYVGRLAGNRTAQEETMSLGKSIWQNLVNHCVSHLDTEFPIKGPTRLKVAGKWIKATAGRHIRVRDP